MQDQFCNLLVDAGPSLNLWCEILPGADTSMPPFSQSPSLTSLPFTGEGAELLGCPKRRCCLMELAEAMARGASTCAWFSGARLGYSLLFCPLCLTGTSVSLIHSSAEQASVLVAVLKVVLPSRSQGMNCKGRRWLAQRRTCLCSPYDTGLQV